mgnify:CR=1 FL=1
MRTTIRVDDDLLAHAKAHAARTRRTLDDMIEEALRTRLQIEQSQVPPSEPMPTFGGSGLRAGVDLNDSAGLLDVMESRR